MRDQTNKTGENVMDAKQIKLNQEVKITSSPVFEGLVYQIKEVTLTERGLWIKVSRIDPQDENMVYSQEMRPENLEVV